MFGLNWRIGGGLLALIAAGTVLAAETTSKHGITMVDIPAGSFLMGSCKQTAAMEEENRKRAFLGQPALSGGCGQADPDAHDAETPQHHVNVRAFQMGKTPVTLSQFKRFIVDAGRSDVVNEDFIKYNAHGDDAPVVQVSWEDAQSFIAWLNRTDGGSWRLPSEAEWEYACRAGARHTYCGGNNVGEVAWYDNNSGGRQRPVAGKRSNAFGLHDMSGNVWEWVQDCWHDSYAGAPSDGGAWTSGCSAGGRVLRGGSWNISARYSRAANRIDLAPGIRGYLFGFRLARTR
ncbi:MAG TPA: formylglycine-generating enzyme family protein [Rubrivivax sp.]|nr:formylglycine-generating enzyme family protein [Rubrivivax sp.]